MGVWRGVGLWVMAVGAVCRIGAEINNSNQKLLASGSTGAMAASLPSPLLRWGQLLSDLIYSACLEKKNPSFPIYQRLLLHTFLKLLKEVFAVFSGSHSLCLSFFHPRSSDKNT